MELVKALRLSPYPRLALVGAGGKTTALFQIARQSTPPVLVSTTTHLAVEQLSFADRHFPVHLLADLPAVPCRNDGEWVHSLESKLVQGVNLLTGPVSESGRVKGLELDILEKVLAFAEARKLPLLVEADGSRCRPLKAPAEHEPALPAWVDTVIVMAGLSGLGQPLCEEWVHRPEHFASLSGLAMGAEITPDALAQVLVSPEGGLKGIPPGARRLVLLNQADTPELQAQGQALVSKLLEFYSAVVVASLNTPNIYAVHERVAGIILAAGSSSRLGQSKQLLAWRGEPLARHVARTALAAGLTPVVMVTGAGESVHSDVVGNTGCTQPHLPHRIRIALKDLPVTFVPNPDWEQGQSTSIVAGLKSLPVDVGAVVFLLVDQPQIPPELVRRLVEVHASNLAPIVAPQAGGRRANPVLFDRRTFPDLMQLVGDVGGRALFSRYAVEWLPWHDEKILLDVDTPQDYARLLDM